MIVEAVLARNDRAYMQTCIYFLLYCVHEIDTRKIVRHELHECMKKHLVELAQHLKHLFLLFHCPKIQREYLLAGGPRRKMLRHQGSRAVKRLHETRERKKDNVFHIVGPSGFFL